MEDSKVLKKGRKIQKFLRKEGKLRNSEPLRFPPAFLAQDGGFNHSDDMEGSGQTCTTHKNQQELSEKANNEQNIPLKPSCQLAFTW